MKRTAVELGAICCFLLAAYMIAFLVRFVPRMPMSDLERAMLAFSVLWSSGWWFHRGIVLGSKKKVVR